MEDKPAEKGNKSKLNRPPNVNVTDSNYGSLITGTSSSSSISLSLFSESDLAEAPSTSGCSSEMASGMQSRQKKERAKEFMRKLKSMLPMKERTRKMDTLSTLEQLVNSMRQLNEEQKRDNEFKTPPPHNGSYHGIDAERLLQSNMHISVTFKNHVVQTASVSLMEHLGYPVNIHILPLPTYDCETWTIDKTAGSLTDWWKGRLLKDFINKKDINTVNSCIALHSNDDDCTEVSDTLVSSSTGGGMKEGSKYFYTRIRRFRKLGAGFNLQNVVSYCPFMMMITTKFQEQLESSEEEGNRHRKCLMIYCYPLSSAYIDGSILPKQWKFSLRHSLFCNYTYVHPNAVCLLGFLPQDFIGMSIFDLYHPDDFQQLLEIHKKIVLSMGQPFKSGSIRLRTRNGCYVEVETEWSSFMNPWSMRLEFIIGQHTIIKRPSHTDIFEDLTGKPEKVELSPESRKIQESILEVLKKPIQGEQSTVGQSGKDQSSQVQKTSPVVHVVGRDPETAKVAGVVEKPKVETASLESKSTLIDDKGISSIYSQLNYSHNIKRFLMSHPKSFSNVSDEDSVMTRDDSEDEAINDEEELPLEIPVVKPPSCGSSTQVHVSEQGHGDDMLILPTFGDETVPPRDSADNIHLLTEETLKKHTKLQERLYLQRIAEEQPLLLNMRRIKSSRHTSHQKRPRIKEAGEEVEAAKHPCTSSGVFRSSSNIFMQSFPAVTSGELTSVTSTTPPMFHQSGMANGTAFDRTFIGRNIQHGFQPFITGFQAGHQGSIAIPTQPAIHLVSGGTVPMPCITTSLGPVVPNTSLINLHRSTQPQNMHWPYYPQTGYTLLPQVMTGFYRPILQPVQVQALPPQNGGFSVAPLFQEPLAQDDTQGAQPAKKSKIDRFHKKNGDSENPLSSVEDTTSSIMYLLEADSSTFEDSDNKASTGVLRPRVQNKRSPESPWLRGVKWNADTKMRYMMPQRKSFLALKMDEKMLKKTQQSELVQTNLEQLLEDISLPNHEDPMDEEGDYIFFPGDEAIDGFDKNDENTEKVNITQSMKEVKNDRGGGSEGSSKNMVWSLEHCENEDDNYETPVNSNSEDEKTLEGIKEEEKEVKTDEGPHSSSSKALEEGRDITMETVFISNSQSGDSSSLTKRGSSPKDGSLSGDEGSASDGGQKAEMEDSQSNCSKVSSDLTPSDNRSNEEASSSMKESDACVKDMKGVSSVASSNSSNDQISHEECLNVSAMRKSEDIFRKLFIPLKVQVCQKLNTPATPFWLVEAHLSHRVAMTYRVSSRHLEDVLSEDKKKMSNYVQSATVKKQLLQLLNEVDMKSAATAVTSSHIMPIISTTPSSVYTQSTLSRNCLIKAVKKETSSDDKSFDSVRSIDVDTATITPHNYANPATSVSMESLTETSSSSNFRPGKKSGWCEEPAPLKSCITISMEGLPSTKDKKTSPTCKLMKEEHSSSETNTDPVAEEPHLSSSEMGHSSSMDIATISHKSRISSRTDYHIQKKFKAMESSSLSGQTIEDIIMSRVFFPLEMPSASTDIKSNPSMVNMPE